MPATFFKHVKRGVIKRLGNNNDSNSNSIMIGASSKGSAVHKRGSRWSPLCKTHDCIKRT